MRQSNNVLLIEDPTIAGFYLDYWQRLLADGAEQGAALRTRNNQALLDTAEVTTVWFSPNTEQKTKGTKTPGDLAEVLEVIGNARQAVLMLALQPGRPGIVEATAEAQKKNPNLIVFGAATDTGATEQYDTELYHRTTTSPDVIRHTDAMTAVGGIDDEFALWRQELMKTSPQANAIIQDRMVVVDPLSEDCVVITGSHNLGSKASSRTTRTCSSSAAIALWPKPAPPMLWTYTASAAGATQCKSTVSTPGRVWKPGTPGRTST